MNANKQRCLGIIDSGVGGLTIAHRITERLPALPLVYFGDTAHFPYGDQSIDVISQYVAKIIPYLCDNYGCTDILIACNSAATACVHHDIRNQFKSLNIFDVISPVVEHVGRYYAEQTVGLIGTSQTIKHNLYGTLLQASGQSCHLQILATPLLAPAIEYGFSETPVIEEILKVYLSHPQLQEIDALILGCTHYPVIAPQIANYYHGTVTILDVGTIVANHLASQLPQSQDFTTLLGPAQQCFIVSALTPEFLTMARRFFQEPVSLQAVPLWETVC